MQELTDMKLAAWILEPTKKAEEQAQGQQKGAKRDLLLLTLPQIFPAYAKLLHPIWVDKDISDHTITWNQLFWESFPEENEININTVLDASNKFEQNGQTLLGNRVGDYRLTYSSIPFDIPRENRMLWRELAEQRRLTIDGNISVEDFFDDNLWPRYLFGPNEGKLDESDLAHLVELLAAHTGDQRCYYYFDSASTDEFEERLLEGKLIDAIVVGGFEFEKDAPNNWWPEDRSWCVASDESFQFTFIGGSKALISDLLADDRIECLEVTSRTSP